MKGGEVQSLGYHTVVFVSCDCVRVDGKSTCSFKTENVFRKELYLTLGKVLAMRIVLGHHQTPHIKARHLNDFSKIF